MHAHKILRIASHPEHLQDSLCKELKISKILAQVLINRGIITLNEADKFLNVELAHMLDPFSFNQMHRAVERIKQAVDKKEKVMVFGDYDVDGITSMALLKQSLMEIGLDASHYMPHRIKEGYGLTKDILRIAKEKKIKLLITVDCGISNYDEIEALKKHGIDTIITDHHEPQGDLLPPASSIINPKVKSCGYRFRELAGVGVAYKLCQALRKTKLLDALDLVTLGTIADVVPLTGENRVIVKEGLSGFQKAKDRV